MGLRVTKNGAVAQNPCHGATICHGLATWPATAPLSAARPGPEGLLGLGDDRLANAIKVFRSPSIRHLSLFKGAPPGIRPI